MAGEGSITEIKTRLQTVEQNATANAPQEGDGIEIVGAEIRMDIASLPNAPEN